MKDALAAEIDKDYNQLDTATVTCHPSPDQEDPLNNLGLPASDMHTWEAQGMPQHLQFVHAQVINTTPTTSTSYTTPAAACCVYDLPSKVALNCGQHCTIQSRISRGQLLPLLIRQGHHNDNSGLNPHEPGEELDDDVLGVGACSSPTAAGAATGRKPTRLEAAAAAEEDFTAILQATQPENAAQRRVEQQRARRRRSRQRKRDRQRVMHAEAADASMDESMQQEPDTEEPRRHHQHLFTRQDISHLVARGRVKPTKLKKHRFTLKPTADNQLTFITTQLSFVSSCTLFFVLCVQ